MYEETPNKEEIDWIADRLRDIYQYEKLKDCDIDYLHNLEFGVEAQMLVFESTFPHDQSAIQGPLRAVVYDDEDEDKMSLSDAEKIRIEFLKEEITREIHRAKGHRLELRREHRSRLANSVSDAVSNIVSSIPGL